MDRDASAIYGQNTESQRSVRTFNDGKLKLGDGGLLEVDSRNIPITGDARNPWMGVSVLQSLFVSEHNLVCDTLKVITFEHLCMEPELEVASKIQF